MTTERQSGRFTLTSESRRSDAEDETGSHSGPFLVSTNSPAEGSPVSKIGRFAVLSANPREIEIQDFITKNKEHRRNSGGGAAVQDTLASLSLQISVLIDRNAYLEAENIRLRKKCGELLSDSDSSVRPTPHS